MDENSIVEVVTTQKRTQSVLFWLGLFSSVYEAIVNALAGGGIDVPAWMSALGVGLATVLVYCNGNNPSLSKY